MKKYLALLLLIAAMSVELSGQFLCKGRVRDSKSKEFLAFVNIVFNDDAYKGVVSDIDGKFLYRSETKIRSITISYIGYKTLNINFDSTVATDNLLIDLEAKDLTLQEVIISAGENPAHRIIRQVIANKNRNDPENVESFTYTSYNKTICDFTFNDSLAKDSIQIEIDSVLKGGHLLMMESVTKRNYLKTDKSEETIIATRVSGFKHPSFATLATDIQPFSFYKDIISIFDIKYLNPIAAGSLSKYHFTLKDTLYQGEDTVFVISFKPKPGKNFEGLTGLLYIHTNYFAIQNVIAEPYEKGFIDVKIQQLYTCLENKHWFPNQLNFDLKIKQYPGLSSGIYMKGKSYISAVELRPTLKARDFSQASIKLDAKSSEQDSVFWQINRAEELNDREAITYRVLDSLGEKNKFERALNMMEKIAVYKFPLKYVDLDLTKLFINNRFEGQRLGLGLYTNETMLKWFTIGGFFGYGLNDKQWKYGGDFTWALKKSHEMELKGFYQNTLAEAGNINANYLDGQNFGWRKYVIARVDRVEQKGFSFGLRMLRYLKLNVSATYSELKPQYNYTFQTQKVELGNSFINAEARISLRYAYKEKVVESFNTRMSQGTNFPVFSVTYSRGLKNVYGSQFDYHKLEAQVEQKVYLKNVGETRLRLRGGYIDTPLPYALMYTGEGSFDKKFPYLLRNYFQSLEPYEFLSDRYVNFFFSHHFGTLLLKTDKFKPKFSIYHNMGWGMLEYKELHKGIDFITKEKGFYESGLIIDDLLRFNYLNIAYLGVGGGVFYRYGSYANQNRADNFVYRLSVTFSTK